MTRRRWDGMGWSRLASDIWNWQSLLSALGPGSGAAIGRGGGERERGQWKTKRRVGRCVIREAVAEMQEGRVGGGKQQWF